MIKNKQNQIMTANPKCISLRINNVLLIKFIVPKFKHQTYNFKNFSKLI